MNRPVLSTPLVLALICSTAAAGHALQEIADAGAKVAGGFVPQRTLLVLGQPARLNFIVRNDGPGEFQFTFGGDYRGVGRHDRFKIDVTNEAGEPMPDPRGKFGHFGGMYGPKTLKPGESFIEPIDLAAFRTIDKPGKYHVTASFAFQRWNPQKQEEFATAGSEFDLTIQPPTPQNIKAALTAAVAEVRIAPADEREQMLNDMVTFGGEAAAPAIIEVASALPPAERGAAFNALARVPGQTATDALLVALKDADPQVRAAAASAMGARDLPEVIHALLAAAGDESHPVRKAVLIALGQTKTPKALPLLAQSLRDSSPEIQDAAIEGLVRNGGDEAIAVLEHALNDAGIHLRYGIAHALAEKLRRPASANWFVPILLTRDMSREWYASLSDVRMYTGKAAVPTLLGCVDFTQGWSQRNWWLLEAVKVCEGAPRFDYVFDPNREGSPEEIEQNLGVLVRLRPLAAVFPAMGGQLAQRPRVPVKLLECDPPIDFVPKITPFGVNSHSIRCGFYSGTIQRTRSQEQYTPTEPYRRMYEQSNRLGALVSSPHEWPQLKLSEKQVEQLRGLSPPGGFHGSIQWHVLHARLIEAPQGPLRDRAEADLLDSVQACVQDYHRATRDFVAAAEKILTPQQLGTLNSN